MKEKVSSARLRSFIHFISLFVYYTKKLVCNGGKKGTEYITLPAVSWDKKHKNPCLRSVPITDETDNSAEWLAVGFISDSI
jgi:hypothetical protein